MNPIPELSNPVSRKEGPGPNSLEGRLPQAAEPLFVHTVRMRGGGIKQNPFNLEDIAMTREEFDIAVDKLEAIGLLRKTGEFKLNRAGVLEPVYAAVPNDELTPQASES